ncbi:MAG: hypothetical protein M3R62_04510, partial [Acidobacteriota bacterium]|nr:hypothetical protein [Acidobacteriota bacterium]
TGVGTAVGLTGDTGYFWFFSSNNVELAVKVLDARGLNSRFWVFYGALSNVEYAMKVTDTLTGNVNTYSNPSGRFASVGDTEGFQTGYSVAAQLDQGRAVSKVIPAPGGTLSATAADGTVFTLTVPDGALLSGEKITMTPVAAIDRLPLSGGLVAAVQLAPEGLLLFQPATLVISPPAAIPVDEETTFAWRGTGEEFFLYPPDPIGTPAISLALFHFSGYGVGRGSSGDTAAQRGRPPASKADQLEQNLQGPAAEQRKMVRSGGTLGQEKGILRPSAQTPAQVEATRVLTDYFLNVLGPTQPLTCSDNWKGFLGNLKRFQHRVLTLTGPDTTLLNAVQAYYASLYKLLAECYDKAYGRCKSDKDPFQGEEMARLWWALVNAGPGFGLPVDTDKIRKCLTFELTFDSFIQEPPIPNLAGATLVWRHQVNATVPLLTFSNVLGGNNENVSADLKYTIDYTYSAGDSQCSFGASGDPSVFRILRFVIDINLFEGNGSPRDPLTIKYDPGYPNFTFTLTCGDAPAQTITAPRWREIYEIHHAGEFTDPTFLARDWTKSGGGDPYAFKKYEPASVAGKEKTAITLKHTPQ